MKIIGIFQLPWLREFVVDSGWAADVIKCFNAINKDEVNDSVQAAFEDLLCCVAKASLQSAKSKKKLVQILVFLKGSALGFGLTSRLVD
jgi:hypothetical protein